MREILFRGKSRYDGRWVEGSLLTVCLDTYSELEKKECTHCIVEPNVEMYRGEIGGFEFVIPETVGQYTGLTDKNGKKIFDGDILSVTVREFVRECGIRKCIGKTKQTVWTVEYAERRTQGNGFYVFGKDRRFSLGLTRSVIYNANPEIIGNVYDNPELLK